MEIDPDVADLMREPPPKLPEALTREGWGTQRIVGSAGTRHAPSTEQQPTYNYTCAQCGRPITMLRWEWTDHVGRTLCENVLLESQVSSHHVTADEVEMLGARTRATARWRLEVRQPSGPCGAMSPVPGTPGRDTHIHTCLHPTNHFGFHECTDPTCRHIWR